MLTVGSGVEVTLTNLVVTGGVCGIVNNGGTVNLNGESAVRDNTCFGGGGILNAGTVNLNDTSTISGNTAGTRGGGIFNFTGVSFTLNLNGGTVSGNTAGIEGNDIFTGSI